MNSIHCVLKGARFKSPAASNRPNTNNINPEKLAKKQKGKNADEFFPFRRNLRHVVAALRRNLRQFGEQAEPTHSLIKDTYTFAPASYSRFL